MKYLIKYSAKYLVKCVGKKTALCSLALLAAANAFAKPNHIRFEAVSELEAPLANCVFPDGTFSPRGESFCYTPDQVAHAYGFDTAHLKGITGKGQTIIIVSALGSPTAQADLDHFSDTFKLPRTKIDFIYPQGPYLNPVSNSDQSGWASETSLDLQWSHTMAPDAKIVNIITNHTETEGLEGLPEIFAGLQQVVDKYPNAIVSMSFAADEPTFTTDDLNQYLRGSFHQIFQTATDRHLTFLAGSGDNGSTNVNLAQDSFVSTPNVNYPASDPLVTAVGGTWLQINWKWAPEGNATEYRLCKLTNTCKKDFLASVSTDSTLEAVWKEDWLGAGTGGGVSTVFDMPDYQQSVGTNNLDMMKGHRALPDLSMNAAVDGGVMVYTSFGPKAKWNLIGGTSLATPETAGVVALAGQLASDKLGRTVGVGQLNPILYQISNNNYNDVIPQTFSSEVTLSSNDMFFNETVLARSGPLVVPPVYVPGYATTVGFDMTTGWGTPKGLQFLNAVSDAVVARETAKKR